MKRSARAAGANGTAAGEEAVPSAFPMPAAPSLPSYRLHWTLILLGSAAFLWWLTHGSAASRRRGVEAARVPEVLRTDRHFVVVAFPRVTPDGYDSTIPHARFSRLVSELAARGYHAIGFQDLREFYAGGRGLPPKSILLAMERDNPQSIALVEKTLRRLGWRAAAFMDRSSAAPHGDIRRALSAHAVSEMLDGGAWDFGTSLMPGSVPPVEGVGRGAVLWGITPLAVALPNGADIRIQVGKTGYNDAEMPLRELRAVPVRPEASVEESLHAIEAFQPRVEPFEDRFPGPALSPDWVSDWGVISGAHERLAVLPQPNQRSASASLKGTDRWTDMVLEFTLLRYRGEAWAHARAREPERWVRIGVENDVWRLQQKTGPRALPVTLAQAPLQEGLPARVRLILKGPWALVYLGDRVQFGKGLWVDEAVGHGRVEFVARADRRWAAKAVFGAVRARPLEPRWLAFQSSPERSPELLVRLRAEAAVARGMSPAWLTAGSRGSVQVAPPDDLTRALAGFYRCRLVPAVTFSVWPRPADFRALAAGLAAAAESLGVPGVNLRLPPDAPGAAALARELRAALWARRRLLWVTARSPEQARAWRPHAEGLLLPAGSVGPGLELLRASR